MICEISVNVTALVPTQEVRNYKIEIFMCPKVVATDLEFGIMSPGMLFLACSQSVWRKKHVKSTVSVLCC